MLIITINTRNIIKMQRLCTFLRRPCGKSKRW